MRLADGNYRLKADPNPPGKPDMRFEVRTGGAYGTATFGEFEFDPGHDWYWLPGANVVIRFVDATHFIAIVAPGTPGERQYAGTYASEK